ncbi:MAG: hypothetical protein CVV02_08160 [Firmicutes bacterium HGW-Firmicutes-7]|nr:MAG: hypothetical protein CVV02_08160 [Firmicutes bacterium HGW-Firmicutes-7]
MKGFHKFLGVASIIFLAVLVVATSFTGYYISKNKDILSNFGNFKVDGKNFDYNWSIFNNNRSSQFETLTVSQTDNFTLPDSIVINSSLEDVIFIEEDRSDIMVEYYNEYPNSPLYSIDYKIEQLENTLYINSYYSVTNIFIDRAYASYINVHIPKDYQCNILDLTLSMGEITNHSIFDNINNLYLSASLGNVELDITTPKESISVNSEMGAITLNVSAPVQSFDSKSNFGEIKLNFTETIGTLVCELDMGSLEITSDKNIEHARFSTKMGSTQGTFYSNIATLSANADLGNIDLSFYDNDSTATYIDSNLGHIDVDSSFKVVKESEGPDFRIYSNMGNVTLSSK